MNDVPPAAAEGIPLLDRTGGVAVAVGLTSIASQSRNRACGFCTELPLFGKNKCSKHTYGRRMQPSRSRLSRRQSAVPPTHMTLPHPPRSRPCALVPYVHRSGKPIVRDRSASTRLWNTSPTAFTARQSAAYVPNVGSRPAHAGAFLFPVVDGCGDILEAAVLPSVGTWNCSVHLVHI